LVLTAVLACVLPSQALAASSPVVIVPSPCGGSFTSAPGAGLPITARSHSAGVIHVEVVQFCSQLSETAGRANSSYNNHYTAATRRRIRRVLAEEALRIAGGQNVVARLDRYPANPHNIVNFPDLPLGKVKEFARKSLTKLKTVVGGAIKFVPHVKLLRCGVFAALAGAAAYIDGGDRQKVLLAAGGACIGSIVGDLLPSGKKKP